MNKNIIFYIISFGALIIINGAIFYIKTVNGSFTPTNLGTLGDFLNPFITIVNLIVVAYLTFMISRIENNRNQENLNNQKLIVLTQLRMDAVRNFEKTLDELYKSTNETTRFKSNEALMYIVNTIAIFQKSNRILFKDLFTKKFDKEVYGVFYNSAKGLAQAMQNRPEGSRGFPPKEV